MEAGILFAQSLDQVRRAEGCTLAYRQPTWARSRRIFEVDYPATQKWKRAKLAAAEISILANVMFVPVDFERISREEGLAAGGLDFRIPTFFSSLRVTQYLAEEALDLSLNFVLSLPHQRNRFQLRTCRERPPLGANTPSVCVCRYRWRERRVVAESIFPGTACQQTQVDGLFEGDPLLD